MFSELTLALHILLLILIYVFLLVAVRIISKDLFQKGEKDKDKKGDPRIIIIEGDEKGFVEYLIDHQLLIGRGPDCDISLNDAFVSTHHARVYASDSGYWLEDMGSTNGTTINGKQVDGTVRLKKDSKFKIGQYAFKFVD